MWTLGLALWMFDRDRAADRRLAQGQVRQGARARRGQYRRAERRPCLWRDGRDGRPGPPAPYRSRRRPSPASTAPSPAPRRSRSGLVAGAQLAGLPMFFGGYPITPGLARSSTICRASRNMASPPSRPRTRSPRSAPRSARASPAQLGVTSSSGPGIALKTEAMGLAIMTELPLVIVNSQRGGPSTGLPTKTEQSDLYQAVYGRNGDAPMPVIAARSPADAFDCAIEACRIAIQYMTPVMLLTDGYIANAAEPWKVPDMSGYRAVPGRASTTTPPAEGRGGQSLRARRQARPGLDQAGHAGPDAPDRRHREECRHRPYRLCARQPPGDDRHPRRQGRSASRTRFPTRRSASARQAASWRWSAGARPSARSTRRSAGRATRGPRRQPHPHPPHLAAAEKSRLSCSRAYEQILVPEMNSGQLKTLLRDQYLVDARPVNKVSGQPFKIAEIEAAIEQDRRWRCTEASTRREAPCRSTAGR